MQAPTPPVTAEPPLHTDIDAPLSGPPVPEATATPSTAASDQPSPGLRLGAWLATQVHALIGALGTGVRGALFRPRADRPAAPGVTTLLALVAASLLLVLVDGLLRHGLEGRFYAGGLPSLVLPHSFAAVTLWGVLTPARATRLFLPALVAVTAVHLVIDTVAALALAALDHFAPTAWPVARAGAPWLGWAWTWAATLFVVAQAAPLSLRAKAWAAIALPLLWLAPGAWFTQNIMLWDEDWAQRAETQAPESAASEAAWARQPELLHDALAQVTPGRAGTTELFHIVMGTYGGQDVFVREARAAHALLNQRFGATGHGVLLANHASSALDLPFANLTTLRDTLATVAERMNPDEDVLFLYITTHGSPEHDLSVDLWPYQFDALNGANVRAALDESGIRYRVIVLSACYAGGLIPALQGPDTAVFTAAAADRTSFGCANGRDWTYFGEAFYTQGLAQTTDLERAFELARASVTQRETAEGQTPSLPQSSVGDGIRFKLRTLAHGP